MLPASPCPDPADSRRSDAKFGGNDSAQARVLTNCANLLKRQFSGAASLATVGRAVSDLVGMIVRGRIPSQVVDVVVAGVAVVVATLHAIGAFALKRPQDKPVHFAHLAFVVSPEKNAQAAKVSRGRLFQPSGSSVFDSALVRYLVKTVELGDWFPSFHSPYFKRNLGGLS